MDEEKTPFEESEAKPALNPEDEAQPEVFSVPPRSGKEPWRSGGGCGRLPAYGCAIGIVLLVAALFAGVSLLRKSVWMTMERGRQQVVQGLPFQLPPGERLRTTRNLERFRTVLETAGDPYPLIGEFVKRVRAVFEDGQFTIEEIEELNLFLEGVIEEAGIPGMQLGLQNSEFGIRNSEFRFRVSCPTLRSIEALPVSRRCSRIALPERMPGTPIRGSAVENTCDLLRIVCQAPPKRRAQARPNTPQNLRFPPRADNSEFRIPNSEFL